MDVRMARENGFSVLSLFKGIDNAPTHTLKVCLTYM